MNIIQYILKQPELVERPPVLLDIGASGEIHQKWKKIAGHSVCIAFDADEREFSFAEKKGSEYRKLFVVNRIVSDHESSETNFYLTRFPFCSSALPPDQESLDHWAFGDKFIVEKKLKLQSVTLSKILDEQKINYIDWFKADTQGTDLRIYKSISDSLRKDILAAEFEPGIMDGYQNEDKLYDVLKTTRDEGYFVSEMDIKGTQRIRSEYFNQYSSLDRIAIGRALKKSPGWAEITCLRELERLDHSLRSYLLLFCFAWIEDQFGYALEIARSASQRTSDPRFALLEKQAHQKIKKLAFKLPLVVLKKQFNKLLKGVHV